MCPESTIVEQVETCVRHPVFAGSDQTMVLVLDDLESLEGSGRIDQATYRRLREMILSSPHIVFCRRPPPRASTETTPSMPQGSGPWCPGGVSEA